MLSIGIDIGNAWLDALLGLLAVLALVMIVVLALVYIERKFSARIQMRLGPMRVGPYGTLQTVADAVNFIAAAQA